MSLSIINSMFLQNNSFICLSKLEHLLAHVDAENEMKCKVKGMKQSADSACVVIPTMVFQISEEPLHEFRGHSGDVLNLSWSNNKVSTMKCVFAPHL